MKKLLCLVAAFLFLEISYGQEAQKISTTNQDTNDQEVLAETSSDPDENLSDRDALIISPGQDYLVEEPSRNVFALGYQIGGYTLIGIDYEVRVHDYVGVHFGMGWAGYTAGLKIHTNKLKNSPFFNVSYKDGGFGLLKAFGIEYGGRWVFSRNGEFGLHYQIGLAKILEIDKDIEDLLYDNQDAPPFMLSMGIGFSW